jgi:hypothetical protein
MDHQEEFTLKYLEHINTIFERFQQYSGHYQLGLFEENRDCNDLLEFVQNRCEFFSDTDNEEEFIYESI